MAKTKFPYYYFSVERYKEVATLHVDGDQFIFLGASVEASVKPGYVEKAPITFLPTPEGDIGLIAVSCRSEGGIYSFFVKIGWKDGESYIYAKEKDKPWIPPAHKLAQITNDGKSLSVKIDGEWYTTSSYGASGNEVCISAGNLICQYLVAKKDSKEEKKFADEIKKMAVERKEEISAKDKLTKIRDQVEDLIKKNVELISRGEDREKAIKQCERLVFEVESNRDKNNKFVSDLLEKMNEANEILTGAHFGTRGNSIKSALKIFEKEIDIPNEKVIKE